jgi:Zn finger protein HypA/HybF involved in hydrogenase expression
MTVYFTEDTCMSLAERAAKAAKIVAEPQLYKICEACDSIVTKRVFTCPSCHGYRFNDGPELVIAQAKVLGSREKTGVLSEDLM